MLTTSRFLSLEALQICGKPKPFTLSYHIPEAGKSEVIGGDLQPLVGGATVESAARLGSLGCVCVEAKRPFRMLECDDRMVCRIAHNQQRTLAGAEQQRVMTGCMTERGNRREAGDEFGVTLVKLELTCVLGGLHFFEGALNILVTSGLRL